MVLLRAVIIDLWPGGSLDRNFRQFTPSNEPTLIIECSNFSIGLIFILIPLNKIFYYYYSLILLKGSKVSICIPSYKLLNPIPTLWWKSELVNWLLWCSEDLWVASITSSVVQCGHHVDGISLLLKVRNGNSIIYLTL